MGTDKALLPWKGQPLWQHQLGQLRDLGVARLFISSNCQEPFAGAGCEVIPDVVVGRGPLGGIHAGLATIKTPWLIVLAVDMPQAGTPLLARLMGDAVNGVGVVPQLDRGFEPLAAIYPRGALEIASDRLRGADWFLQGFVGELIERRLVRAWIPGPDLKDVFRNLNVPTDLEEKAES